MSTQEKTLQKVRTTPTESGDARAFLTSFEWLSEATRQLHEMRVEEQRLKENLCGTVVGIINFVGVAIPLSVRTLQNNGNQIEEAVIGTDGVIALIMNDGERTFMKISDLDTQGVLRLVHDMLPKFKGVIEAELKILNEHADLMNKAVVRLEKAQPVLRKNGEGASVDIVDENPNV